jgi:prophage regulatory protein
MLFRAVTALSMEITMNNTMLRQPEVLRRTGLSRTTIWRKIRAGDFPAPRQLGSNSIGWPESEITEWLEGCPRRTYGGEAA